jgi:hypothetical protein
VTISGGPSAPSYLLADAAAVLAGAVWSADVQTDGFRKAWLEEYVDQTHNLLFRGSGVADAATYGWIHKFDESSGVSQLQHNGAAVSGQGRTYQLDIDGLRTLHVRIQNTAGAGATLTVRITLVQ